MPVEDNGPVIDPRRGLRTAIDTNRRDNALHMRPTTAWLAAKAAAYQAMLDEYEAEYGPLDEEAEE